MTNQTPTIPLPVRALHRVIAAGRFPHFDRDFLVRYGPGGSHALHLYGYACGMRWSGIERDIQPGDVTISPAHGESRYHLPKPGRHWCIHFMPRAVAGQTMEVPLHVRLGARSEAVAERMARIARLTAAGRATDASGALAVAAAETALQELLLWLALEAAAERRAPRRRADAAAERVAALIAERFAEPLSVPTLAREAGVSQNRLAARFRERFGVTVPSYLLARRIERARQLLATTSLPVRAVGAAVGMPDAQHFNKQFRRLVGHPPSAERA